jgi:hypothetical protein
LLEAELNYRRLLDAARKAIMSQTYYWVVTCKNIEHHCGKNPFHGYRIPVGRTDPHSPRPCILDKIEIQCDDPECRKTYSYTAPEIILWCGDTPWFPSRPLF